MHISLFRTQNWYWFFATIFLTYGRIANTIFGIEVPYHLFASFCLLIIGFVGFVLALKQVRYSPIITKHDIFQADVHNVFSI